MLDRVIVVFCYCGIGPLWSNSKTNLHEVCRKQNHHQAKPKHSLLVAVRLLCYRVIVLLLCIEPFPNKTLHVGIPNEHLLEAILLLCYRVNMFSCYRCSWSNLKQNLHEAVRLSCYPVIVLSCYCRSCIIEYVCYRVILLSCHRVRIVFSVLHLFSSNLIPKASTLYRKD